MVAIIFSPTIVPVSEVKAKIAFYFDKKANFCQIKPNFRTVQN